MLELTTRFTAISTGVGTRRDGSRVQARNRVDPTVAAKKADAHVRYIDRPKAVGERAVSGIYDPATGIAVEAPAEVRGVLRSRARDVAVKGGAGGARVLEKGIVSLPNSWPAEARQAACNCIAAHLAPAGSEAMALVVTHRDKKQNSHLHFAAIDGRESPDAARLRRPNAQRVRRQNVLRMSEGGRPKQLREEIADILNRIAAEQDLEPVEWRSFAAREILTQPGDHEGPKKRAVAMKTAMQEAEDWLDAQFRLEGLQPIDEVFGFTDTTGAPGRPQATPSANKGPSASPALSPAKLMPPHVRKPQSKRQIRDYSR